MQIQIITSSFHWFTASLRFACKLCSVIMHQTSLFPLSAWHNLGSESTSGVFVVCSSAGERDIVIITQLQMGVWVYIAAGSCLASGQCITAGNYRAFLQTDSQIALSLFSKNPWRLNASKQQIKVGMPAPITSLLLWWVSEWVSERSNGRQIQAVFQSTLFEKKIPVYYFYLFDYFLLNIFIQTHKLQNKLADADKATF